MHQLVGVLRRLQGLIRDKNSALRKLDGKKDRHLHVVRVGVQVFQPPVAGRTTITARNYKLNAERTISHSTTRLRYHSGDDPIEFPPPDLVVLEDGTSHTSGSTLVRPPFNENREECGEG